jgi:hypothetical protein
LLFWFIYFAIYFYLCNFNYSLFFVVILFCFSFCEGLLGLSVWFSIISSYGNDYFQSHSVVQCQDFFVFEFFDPFMSIFWVFMVDFSLLFVVS